MTQGNTLNNLALQVSRRQKRLKFWTEQFSLLSSSTPGAESGQVANLLSSFHEQVRTYQLLLSRLVGAKQQNHEADAKDCEDRLDALDRVFATQFETIRLLTSKQGTSAIVDFT